MAFVFGRQNILHGQARHRFAQLDNIFDSLADAILFCSFLRHNPGDRLAMPGDDKRLPPFDIIEKGGQVCFGFRSLNVAHHFHLVD